MKSVLENVSVDKRKEFSRETHRFSQPEPLQNLSNLVKAQLIFFSTAAETLSVSRLLVKVLRTADLSSGYPRRDRGGCYCRRGRVPNFEGISLLSGKGCGCIEKSFASQADKG